MYTKSVMAGEYTAPPAQGPRITLIWGITPDARVFRRKIVGIACQRDYTLLNPCTAGIVQADERRPVLQGHILKLDDFLGVRLGERASEHGKILGKNVYEPTMDRAIPSDDPVP